jgi:hypothetical protein
MRLKLKNFVLLLCASSLTIAALQAQTIRISPGFATVGVNQTVQYTAATTGLNDANVTWKVGNMVGGNATYGTITTKGLYTAPGTIPAQDVTVTALGSDNMTFATVYVSVAPPGPMVTAISPNPVPAGSPKITVSSSGIKPNANLVCNGVQLSPTITPMTLSAGVYIPNGTATLSCKVANPGTLYGNTFTIPVTAFAPGNPGGGGGSSAPVVAPATAIVVLGAIRQFISAGATSWSATAGTVTPTGLYSAPSVMTGTGNDTVTATNATGSGTAKVQLISNVAPVILSTSVQTVPLGIFTMTVTGTGFGIASKATLGASALSVTGFTATTLSMAGFAGVSGNVNLVVNNGPVASQPYLMTVGIPNAQVSAAAARRFLEQAAFGPTPTEALHVQQVGFQGWLNEQFAMPAISSYGTASSQGGLPQLFLANAVTNADQLRQRVAFAYSQIFVTSANKLIWSPAVSMYQQMLLNDAFVNYRQLLNDVTLSPGMGQYLDIANNGKANPALNIVANENYAREVLQLFSIGTKVLNPDGSTQYDVNNIPVATYSQATIAEFARSFTGWTYAPNQGNSLQWNTYVNQNGPMMPYTPQHDTGAKTLLNGYVSPAGVSAQQDLNNALDNIYGHSNVGLFLGRNLIQHLVKSNPGPAYVQSVAAAFNDNGQGVRGDMKAVITAILLDPEARADDDGLSQVLTDGHLQEPALMFAGMVRAFGGQMLPSNYYAPDLAALNEDIFNSPSVFNYFSSFFHAPGTSLFGPEFQIHTPNNAILRANVVAGLFSAYNNPVQTYGPGTTVDLTAFLALASTPATLTDALDLTLTHGTMPAAMKQAVTNAITADTNGNVSRLQTGCYLILTSGFYNVWH